jgi:hypothetical protein
MRLETTQRRPDPGSFLDPIPPTLAATLEQHGVDELAQHRELAGRFQRARDAVGDAQRALQQADAADTQAERAFAASGGKLAGPKVPKARQKLDEAEREQEVLGRELVESAKALVAASAPHIGEAAARVAAQAEADADEARRALEAALEALARRGPVTREAAWLEMAAAKSRVHAWRPAGATPDPAQQQVRMALAAHDEETAKRRERRRQRALEEETVRRHEEGLPLGEARQEAAKTIAGEAGEFQRAEGAPAA